MLSSEYYVYHMYSIWTQIMSQLAANSLGGGAGKQQKKMV